MSMCRVLSWDAGKECLLWPAFSLKKALLAFVLFHFVLQGQTCLLFWVSWLLTFAFQFLMMKRTTFLVLVLEGVVYLHRTGQHQLLQHPWLGHRLGLLCYWMVCLGIKPKIKFWCFWDYIQVLHFRLFCWLWWHYRLDGHEFEQAPRVDDGQGSLPCRSPWGHKELDTT